MKIKALTFDTASDAIQWANASGHGTAIQVDSKRLVVERATVDRMATAGVAFAYLCDNETFGILTVPVN